jgi:hypothetical protein
MKLLFCLIVLICFLVSSCGFDSNGGEAVTTIVPPEQTEYPQPEYNETPIPPDMLTDPKLRPVYKAYYEILNAAINEYGFGSVEKVSPMPNLYSGVIYAELIDFDNDGIPELLFAYSDDSIQYGAFYMVYGFNSGKAELLGTYKVYATHLGVDIITNENSIAYFHYKNLYDYEREYNYYTLVDGIWLSFLELKWLKFDDFINQAEWEEWYINGEQAEQHEYDNALEALNVVDSRQLWWGDCDIDLNTVQSVLTELSI